MAGPPAARSLSVPLLVLAFVLSSGAGGAQGPREAKAQSSTSASFDHGYRDYARVLAQVVDAKGRVNYATVAGDARLDRFLASVASLPPEALGRWTRAQRIAFYINVYNALTLKTIAEVFPIASIRDIQPNPWENARWTVASRKVSLNYIEHSQLRKHLGEPRCHFVLVCAARSCPLLPNRPLVPETLDEDLEAYSQAFFRNPDKNRVDVAAGKVHLSKILEWYGSDFVGWGDTPELGQSSRRSERESAVLRVFARYATPSGRDFLVGDAFTVHYSEYDWGLNGI